MHGEDPVYLCCLGQGNAQRFWESPIALCGFQEPQHLQGLRGQSPGARLGSQGPVERRQQDITRGTFPPGECLSQLGKGEEGEKGSDRKGSLCSAKMNVSYFCLAVALYSNYINYS